MCFLCALCDQAEHAEMVGPLDVVSEYGSERIQQKLGFLFMDKAHPAVNFFNNYQMLSATYAVPDTTIDEVLQYLDSGGFNEVAAAIRTMMPPIPSHVTINETMDRALRSAILHPTPHADSVLRLLRAAYPLLATLWSEFARGDDDPTASMFMSWASEALNGRPADSLLIQSVFRAGPRSSRT